MSSYSELVKKFEKVRSYMRDFNLYGFQSRTEYDSKSARSYDDERRKTKQSSVHKAFHLRTLENSVGYEKAVSVFSAGG